jgi:hypothetical protein
MRTLRPLAAFPLSTLALALLWAAACTPGAENGPTPGEPTFDGPKAMALVDTQVAFGPRVPGTKPHEEQAAWMIARLDSLADTVVVDHFTDSLPGVGPLPLTNVLAKFRPHDTRRILLLTHWDTRPHADQSPDSADRAKPIPGANDGGSGTAVLLELASLLKKDPPPMGIDLLFVDGEDYGPGTNEMFLGATRYAKSLDPNHRPIYGVLLDMVGDADPDFPVEANSASAAPVVVHKVWQAAARLGYQKYFPETVGPSLYDDHIPLNQAGLPTVDVIDFQYGPGNRYWHTLQDTPAHMSAKTLAMVGQVMVELIYSGG